MVGMWGSTLGSETGGALDRPSWPALQPAALACTHPPGAQHRCLPARLVQHQAKRASSAEAAVTSLRWQHLQPHMPHPFPSRPDMAQWRCVRCWCPHRAGAAMHGLNPTDKTPQPPRPSLTGQPCRTRAPQRAAVTASHSSLHSRGAAQLHCWWHVCLR